MAHFSIMWQGSPDMAKLAQCGLMPSTMWGGSKKSKSKSFREAFISDLLKYPVPELGTFGIFKFFQ